MEFDSKEEAIQYIMGECKKSGLTGEVKIHVYEEEKDDTQGKLVEVITVPMNVH